MTRQKRTDEETAAAHRTSSSKYYYKNAARLREKSRMNAAVRRQSKQSKGSYPISMQQSSGSTKGSTVSQTRFYAGKTNHDDSLRLSPGLASHITPIKILHASAALQALESYGSDTNFSDSEAAHTNDDSDTDFAPVPDAYSSDIEGFTSNNSADALDSDVDDINKTLDLRKVTNKCLERLDQDIKEEEERISRAEMTNRRVGIPEEIPEGSSTVPDATSPAPSGERLRALWKAGHLIPPVSPKRPAPENMPKPLSAEWLKMRAEENQYWDDVDDCWTFIEEAQDERRVVAELIEDK